MDNAPRENRFQGIICIERLESFSCLRSGRLHLSQEAIGTRLLLALSQAEFNRFVDDHSAALYRLAYRLMGDRHEAEDMVQEAFRSAWKSRSSYQAGRGDRAWLASILRRRVVDRWRKHPPPSTSERDTNFEVGVEGADPLVGEYTDEMQAALNRLPQELRETLLLVVVGELTHQETANLLGVPLGTVLSRVSRARQKLRETLLAARSET